MMVSTFCEELSMILFVFSGLMIRVNQLCKHPLQVFLKVVYNSRLSNVGNTTQLNTRPLMSQRWPGLDIDTGGVKTLDLSVKTLSSQINKHSLVPHVHTGHHKRLFHDTIGQSEACIPAINQSEAML